MACDYQMKEMEMVLLESDSNDEIEILSIFAMEEERLKREQASTSRRGSILGHKVIKRDYLQSQERLFRDYFVECPVFISNEVSDESSTLFSSSICTRSI